MKKSRPPLFSSKKIRGMFQTSLWMFTACFWTFLYLGWRPAGIQAEHQSANQYLRELFLTAGLSFENRPWEERVWVKGNHWLTAKSTASRLPQPQSADEPLYVLEEMTPAVQEPEFPAEVSGFFRILKSEQNPEPFLLAAWNAQGELMGFCSLPPPRRPDEVKMEFERKTRILAAARGLLPAEALDEPRERYIAERLQIAAREWMDSRSGLAGRLQP